MSAASSWVDLPLAEGGRSLVEASAGTGKTWTITALYLRLLLEEGRSPRQIIVSTFTNAAAAELAERLRGKLLWALAQAEGFDPNARADANEASDVAWLCGRWRTDPATRVLDVQRLQAALTQFDAAPISTLHSLCSRILAEHPFAAGAPFRGRELVDAKSLEATLADDLWRVIAQGAPDDELVQLAQAAGVSRGSLKKYLPVLMQPNVVVADDSPEKLAAAIKDIVGDVDAWAATLASVLAEDGLLQKNGGLRKAWMALAKALDFSLTDAAQVIVEHHAALRGCAQMKGINNPGLNHPEVKQLAELSVRIVDSLSPLQLDMAGSQPLRHFLAAAQRWCHAALKQRLESANQSTFDQLLFTVHDALMPRKGLRDLADALHASWPVALVDEFQDTDPVQFGILDAIYRNGEGAPRGRLVMIGDPKQAIYRFRGGDVQAYERAKAAVPEEDHLTLDTNHRSSRGYVKAINAFYAATGTQLGPQGSGTTIRYQPVKASAQRDDKPLRNAANNEPVTQPLVIHELPSGTASAELEDRALHACAGQIVRALSDTGYRIGDDPLAPGDIAVLLPSHAQIAKLARLLKLRGVPCVAMSQTGVFDTDTARQLRVLMHAIIHVDDPRALRAAWLTGLWGESLGAVQALDHDAVAWGRLAGEFHDLHTLLDKRGPLAVVDVLMERHAARLLDTVEGERILTDLRHLGELLQEAWEGLGGGERLMAWFADQMEGEGQEADTTETRALRLESDAARVKLMTLHASKGLEFGVVFLPLMWKHARMKPSRDGAHLLTDEEGGKKFLLEGPAKALVAQQEYEERYRMLYVALTRAIHACHVFALSPAVAKRPDDAPLNALDLSRLWADTGDAARCIEHRTDWASHEDAQWRDTAASATPRAARALPAEPAGPVPMRHSFSSLIGGRRSQVAEEEQAAEDEGMPAAAAPAEELQQAAVLPTPAPAPTHHAELDALAKVGGADFGNAVHDVFEHRLPGVALTLQQESVRSALQDHGVQPREGEVEALIEPLAARLQAVLETSLGTADGPRLLDLEAADMRAEMEFNYLLDGVSLRALRAACAAHGAPDLVPPRDDRLAGLMNGKIDLVFAHDGRFHVLDYKSNDLSTGARGCLEDYAPAALEHKMHGTGYRFQALLYVIALERYLRERLGEDYRRAQHLGEAWYLFVRATGLSLPDGTPCGVWRHRFDDALLDAVQAVLGGKAA